MKTIKSHPYIVGAIALGLLVGGIKLQQKSASPSVSESLTLAAPLVLETVTALGRLRPQGEIITVAAPAIAQGSRVAELVVAPGDRVMAGELLAVMDNHHQLTTALLRAQEELGVAQARLNQVKAGAKQGEIAAQEAEIQRLINDQRSRIVAQQALVEKFAAELTNAQTENDRHARLFEEGAVSASLRDSKGLTFQTAQRNHQQAQAELTRLQTTDSPQIAAAQAQLARIREVRPVDVQVVQAEVDRAIANVAQIQADLDQTQILAPQNGTVLEILTRVGETMGPQGLLELGATDRMYATAEVYESDIPQVAPGQTAKISSGALPQPLTGTVERIAQKVQEQTIINADPATSIDKRVIEVEIALDEASSAIARSLSNLQVTVEIQR